MENFFIYFLCVNIVIFSCLFISLNDLISVVFCLAFILFNGIWVFILFNAEYLGVVFLMVYIGAVLVFFLFVVMFLDLDVKIQPTENKFSFIYIFFVFLTVSFMYLVLGDVLPTMDMNEYIFPIICIDQPFSFIFKFILETNIERIGNILYTKLMMHLISLGYLFILVILGVLSINWKN